VDADTGEGVGTTAPAAADLHAAEAPLDLMVPSDVAAIEGVVAAVVGRCRALGYPARVCSLNVPVALTEALANAIISGNREDPSKQVRVRAQVDDRAIVLEVVDEGAGFDLDACEAQGDEPGFVEREDGRGLFLMRRLMDRVEQYRLDGQGSAVRLTLHRP
jgi:serine/threonine-protein kinase RsbW